MRLSRGVTLPQAIVLGAMLIAIAAPARATAQDLSDAREPGRGSGKTVLNYSFLGRAGFGVVEWRGEDARP